MCLEVEGMGGAMVGEVGWEGERKEMWWELCAYVRMYTYVERTEVRVHCSLKRGAKTESAACVAAVRAVSSAMHHAVHCVLSYLLQRMCLRFTTPWP